MTRPHAFTAGDDCATCAVEDAALESERDRALRALDIADFEVNRARARARLTDVENKIADRHARQCQDHRATRAARGAKP